MCAVFLLWAGYVHSDIKEDTWYRAESPGFTLVSDLPLQEVQRLADRLQRFSVVLEAYLPVLSETRNRQPVELLVFAKRRDFVRLLQPRHFAAFTQPRLDTVLLVLAPSPGVRGDDLAQNMQHEYVHYRLRSLDQRVAAWFDEGLAGLMQYVEVSGEGNTVQAQIDTDLLFARFTAPLRVPGKIRLKSVLAARRYDHWPQARLVRFYGLAAQLSHFALANAWFPSRHPQGFLPAPGEDSAMLFGLTVGKLEKELTAHRRSRLKSAVPVSVQSEHVPHTVQVASRDQVLGIQARAAEAANPAAAVHLYRQIADARPDSVEALEDLSRALALNDQFDQASAVLARAVQLAPDWPGIRIQQAQMGVRRCKGGLKACRAIWAQSSAELRSALKDAPDRFDAVYLLGLIDLYRGRSGLAVNYLRVVHQQVPWAPMVNYQLGEALRLLGNPRAEVYLTNARDWAADDAVRRYAELSLHLLHTADHQRR